MFHDFLSEVLYKGYHISLVIRCFLPLQNNPKNLDPSRSFGLLRKGITCIIAKFHRTYLLICSHSRDAKNNPKNLDSSQKMDLGILDFLGRVKLVLMQTLIRLIYLSVVILERGKSCLIME